jgi:hypothetical protein
VHFSVFCHWKENSRKVDSFGRGYSVFRSLYERELTGNFGLFLNYATAFFTREEELIVFSLLAKLGCIDLASPSL